MWNAGSEGERVGRGSSPPASSPRQRLVRHGSLEEPAWVRWFHQFQHTVLKLIHNFITARRPATAKQLGSFHERDEQRQRQRTEGGGHHGSRQDGRDQCTMRRTETEEVQAWSAQAATPATASTAAATGWGGAASGCKSRGGGAGCLEPGVEGVQL